MTAPMRVAKIANARSRIAELLADRCRAPESLAREVIDELLRLGWVYPGWNLDEGVPQPSTSSATHRARVLAEARAVVADKKRARTTVTKETEA